MNQGPSCNKDIRKESREKFLHGIVLFLTMLTIHPMNIIVEIFLCMATQNTSIESNMSIYINDAIDKLLESKDLSLKILSSMIVFNRCNCNFDDNSRLDIINNIEHQESLSHSFVALPNDNVIIKNPNFHQEEPNNNIKTIFEQRKDLGSLFRPS